MSTIPESIAQAKAYQRGRQLQRAEQIYRQILKADPTHFEAHYLLGSVYQSMGKLSEAVACFQESLRLKPDFADAEENLRGLLARHNAQSPLMSKPRARDHKSDSPEQLNQRGLELAGQGNPSGAASFFRLAVRKAPNFAEAYSNLGTALALQDDAEQAAACFRRAVELKPDYADAYSNLGNALKGLGRLDEAVDCYERALRIMPNFVDALSNLGNAWRELGRLDAAVACYQRALWLKPDFAEAQYNLGNVRMDQGLFDEALACFQRTREITPNFLSAAHNILYALNFHPGFDAKSIYETHCRWSQQFCEPLAKFIQPHSNEPSADRRLRIGYFSPDFRNHVVGLNLLPLFREHDRRQFEIVCYSYTRCRDAITDRFEAYADIWRNVAGLGDEALAQRIREDRIDILVDLALHTSNRLLLFARKPAPVQVTFAGYPGTTGMAAIDYRLTDVYLDPPGCDDRHYAEESVRLPDSFWCYDPVGGEPDVNPLPALEAGYVTFGCLNVFHKINAPMLKVWAQVLKAVDRSRIMMLAAEGSHRQRALDLLAQEGVAPDRVTFVVKRPRLQYLELYHQIDIGLDTLPYNGHTTSLDSLWMGVPVVTLVGQTVVGRAGLCQLMNLGLPEFIARSPDQFVRIAAELAADLPRLGELRTSLRGRMQNSPLMDSRRFAGAIEAAYRQMWQRWCATR